MSTINDGGPAFPRDERHQGHNGMSLRDYFAAKAMQAVLSKLGPYEDDVTSPHALPGGSEAVPNVNLTALYAYAQADAMLAARGET